MNDGDWVESLTALVETHTGEWQIIYWTTNVATNTNSSTQQQST